MNVNVETHPYKRLTEKKATLSDTKQSKKRESLFRELKKNHNEWKPKRKGMTFSLSQLEHLTLLKKDLHSSRSLKNRLCGAFCTARESLFLEEQVLASVGMEETLRLSLQELEKPLPVALFNQFHSSSVWVAKGQNTITFPYDHHAACFPKADGVATSLTNWIFVIRTADCIPLLFHSDDGEVWGALHVSWRSLQAGILERTFLSLLPIQFGMRPDKLKISLGPSIMKCCYPVGKDVMSTLTPFFKAYGVNREEICPPSATSTRDYPRFDLDLPGLCVKILEGLGVIPEKITGSSLCTACNGNFFSHRTHATPYRNWNLIFKID